MLRGRYKKKKIRQGTWENKEREILTVFMDVMIMSRDHILVMGRGGG